VPERPQRRDDLVTGGSKARRRDLDPANYETIRLERPAEGVVLAVLNRPDKLNAANPRMHDELTSIWHDFQLDRSARVLVLTGAGRAFCAGGDVDTGRFGRAREALDAEEDTISHDEAKLTASLIVNQLLDCPKPVIAAVNGYALGLGATVALLCDVVVAGPSTVFGDPHVKLGIGAGDGGQVIWPLLMGINRAKWHLMTGEPVTGKDAYDMGLVSFYVDDEEVLAKALDCARQLASGAPRAISASKVPINQYIRSVVNVVLPLSLTLEFETMRTEDAEEGASAFLERRSPTFRGR
jgi:enoyl-CoA hydratase